MRQTLEMPLNKMKNNTGVTISDNNQKTVIFKQKLCGLWKKKALVFTKAFLERKINLPINE
ncbi:hypothetical protein EIJ81_07115 [Aliivibrio salmonicida]|uniref:hypothetical protein n=1 Tax=Aliivibrio salmonicida TaxID=40269 RepID=UPI0002EF42A4|nr:hypothetical protein [Aliivibrio salmonicida]AZL84413.1 hypothetical protein EIJ81_07115 [Aliivibrio salmonicida]